MAQRHDWYITIISTGQRYRIEPGESVVIGRTPLRPGSLPPEKAKRLSIPDAQRSMSKRHLLLSLDPQGGATVEDLASTNGTYVVRSDSRLIRLPARRALQLDESPVRLQLGDIGLELTRHDLPAAVRTVAPAVTAARTGEATGKQAASAAERPAVAPGTADSSTAPASASGSASAPEEGAATSDSSSSPASSASDSSATPVVPSEAGSAHADAVDAGSGQHDSGQEDSGRADSSDVPVTPVSNGASSVAKPLPAQDGGSDLFSHGAQDEGPSDLSGGVDDIVAAREGEPTDMFDAGKVRASVRASRTPDASAPAGSTGFEPGSVFDRLTRGEMGGQSAPQVVVDGLTSDEARHSADHDKQFQMARHRQLLPFLAANPYLYQELYDWLASIPDPVIAAALDHNPGYHGRTGQD